MSRKSEIIKDLNNNITPFREQLRKQLGTGEREVGDRPAQRKYWNYIHSSWTGFYNDYKIVVENGALKARLDQEARRVYAENQGRISFLKTVATETKKDRLGAIDSSTPLEQCPAIYSIYHRNQLVRELQQLQSLLSWDTIRFGKLHDLNEALKMAADTDKNGPTHQAAQDRFYSELGKRANQILQDLMDTLGTAQYKDQFPKLQETIQNLYNHVQNNTRRTSYYNKEDARDFYIALGELGRQWEQVLARLFNQDIDDAVAVTADTFKKQNRSEGVADLFFRDRIYTMNLGNGSASQFMTGVTAKFRRQAQFPIQATVSPQSILDSLLSSDRVYKNQMRFIYNNWVALSSFDSRNYKQSVKNIRSKRTASARRKLSAGSTAVGNDGSVAHLRPTILSLFFEPLAEYVNLLMLNTAFWGNRKESKNDLCIFDPGFFEDLETGYNEARPLPVFLLTKWHAYETADVFRYYNDRIMQGELLWSVADLFTGVLHPSLGFAPVQLAEHYTRKVKLLREDKTKNPIYKVLLSDVSIANPTQLSVSNAFSNLLNNSKGRKLKIQFALKASYMA